MHLRLNAHSRDWLRTHSSALVVFPVTKKGGSGKDTSLEVSVLTQVRRLDTCSPVRRRTSVSSVVDQSDVNSWCVELNHAWDKLQTKSFWHLERSVPPAERLKSVFGLASIDYISLLCKPKKSTIHDEQNGLERSCRATRTSGCLILDTWNTSVPYWRSTCIPLLKLISQCSNREELGYLQNATDEDILSWPDTKKRL